jgi:lytic murein transglycosylase
MRFTKLVFAVAATAGAVALYPAGPTALAQDIEFSPPGTKTKPQRPTAQRKKQTPPPVATPAALRPAEPAAAATAPASSSADTPAHKFVPNPYTCKNTVGFGTWLAGFKQEAAAEGISQATINDALGGITFDPGVISRDRRQSFFSQTFTDFYGKLATNNRLQNGIRHVRKYNDIFQRAEKDYGVPPQVIAGFWALESDFGAGLGKLPILRSLTTLAYDCRRGELFRAELKAALKIIDRGDLRPEEMIGSWAGELGQTQFLPRHYFDYAVDYDGDGRRDLMRDIPDIIGSSANFVASLGWRRGEPWLEQVRVPANLPWDQADLAIQHPRSKWIAWGVKSMDSNVVPDNDLPVSLMLPMGRNGPAFLAYPNFQVYLKWNQSLTYATTAAHLGARIGGAAALSRGNGEPIRSLSYEETKRLQQLLAKRGFDVGQIDGKIGAGTRAAVKQVQIKLGQPADSYPTPELLRALQTQTSSR